MKLTLKTLADLTKQGVLVFVKDSIFDVGTDIERRRRECPPEANLQLELISNEDHVRLSIL